MKLRLRMPLAREQEAINRARFNEMTTRQIGSLEDPTTLWPLAVFCVCPCPSLTCCAGDGVGVYCFIGDRLHHRLWWP